MSIHLFWKDFTATENRKGPSLSLFGHGQERLKFDFQGECAHYHTMDKHGKDSGRIDFQSVGTELQMEEMKTILYYTSWVQAIHKEVQDACQRNFSEIHF